MQCSVAVIGLTSSNGFSKFHSLSLSLSYFPFFETSGLRVKRILVCVVEVGTSSNFRLGLVFGSRFRPIKERVNTPVLGLYEGYSKINFRLVGKNKRVVIASKRTLSSNKELLFLLYAYPHTFSPRSVGVNTDTTWTLSSPLPPAVRYVL